MEQTIILAAVLLGFTQFLGGVVLALLDQYLKMKYDPGKKQFDAMAGMIGKLNPEAAEEKDRAAADFFKVNTKMMRDLKARRRCPSCTSLGLSEPDPDCPECAGKGYIIEKPTDFRQSVG